MSKEKNTSGIERRRFRPYSEYKDSGVEWLDKIPAEWGARRLKYVASLTKDRIDGIALEIPYIGLEHIESSMGKMARAAEYGPSEEQVAEGPDSRFRSADILFGKLRPYLAKVFLSSFDGRCSSEFLVLRSGGKISPAFLAYQLLSPGFIAWINAMTYGTKMPRASPDQVMGTPIAIPDADEQSAISTFLDRETTKIDALIQNKERLIELLQEKRTAIITQAVTKGLNPTVPMKDSGVEWLGKIPAHWEVNRLKFVLAAPLKYGANEAAELDNPDLPRYVRITDIDENNGLRNETFKSLLAEVAKEYLLQEGDLLFARSGATAGKTFLYRRSWGTCAFAGYLIRARLDSGKACLEFIRYFTASMSYWQWLASTYIQATIQNVSAERYASLSLPLPPVAEQRAVAVFLDRQTAKIDDLMSKIREAITSLREYRAALISAAVTGKIDVREA